LVIASPTRYITFDQRVGSLLPDALSATKQVANFQVTVHFEPELQVKGFLWTHAWPPPQGTQIPADALAVLGATKRGQRGHGVQFRPGVFNASCGLRIQHPDGTIDPPDEPSIFVSVYGDCAVIGGPLTFQVLQGDEPTWVQDLANDQKAWFLEYFDYSHLDYPVDPPEGFQKTQRAICSVPSQPDNTIVTWTLPNIYSYFLTLDPHAQAIDLHAQGPFQNDQVKAHYELSYVASNGLTYFGDCDDDTATTPLPSSGPSSTPKYMVSRVSGHKPGSLTKIFEQDWYPQHAPQDYYAGKRFNYQLKDTFGEVFPGVWVQERFTIPPGGLPPGFTVNTTQYWVTRLLGLSASKPVGSFNEFDWIRYNWGPTINPNWQTIQLTHNYWASAKDTLIGGINMGAYTFIITPGKPGTVVQNP